MTKGYYPNVTTLYNLYYDNVDEFITNYYSHTLFTYKNCRIISPSAW